MTSWSNRYVGIPFADGGRDRSGLDCWGLCLLVLREQFGIDARDYEYESAVGSTEAIRQIFEDELSNWDIVEVPRVGDVICIRWKGAPVHFGIVSEKGRFIHSKQGVGAIVSKYESLMVDVVAFLRFRS